MLPVRVLREDAVTLGADDLCSRCNSYLISHSIPKRQALKGRELHTANDAFNAPGYPGFTKGRGANFTGGGAGSGRYPGGGGGGSHGAGGLGYLEDGCSSPLGKRNRRKGLVRLDRYKRIYF